MRSPERSRTNARASASASMSARAQELLSALGDVLRAAQARGIALSASFLHFDRRGDGFVGVDELMAALVELRILPPACTWGESEAEQCVLALSGRRSRAFFTRDDFVVYFSASPNASATQRVLANDENAYHNEDAERGANAKVTVQATSKKPQRQQEHGEADREPRREFSLSNNHDSKSASRGKGKRIGPTAKKKRPLGSLLPNWAHDRSKRALKELEYLQQKRRASPWPRDGSTLAATATESARSMGIPPLEIDQNDPMDGDGGNLGEDVNEVGQEDEEAGSTARRVSALDDRDTSIAHFLVEPQYRVFELDNDTSIAYAILTHDTAPSTRDKSLPPMPTRRPHDAIDEPEPVMTPFRFTVFLDIFQRIETLDTFFRPLLTHFPRGKILVCGFPSKIRQQTIMNSEFLAAAYAKLLIYVMETTREWLFQPKLGLAAMPQYVLGFGTGANVALQLLASEVPLQTLKYPSLQRFVQAQRGLVLFNCIANAGDPAIRSTWNAWRNLLLKGTPLEWHEALIRINFSEYYLNQVAVSRQRAMETFFDTRHRFLQGPSLDLLRTLVRGMVKSRDIAEAHKNLLSLPSPFAVIAVHGSMNTISPPTQVEALVSTLSMQVANLGGCLAAENKEPTVHLEWLKCGHDMLQERPTYVNELLRQLVLAPTTISRDGQAEQSQLPPAGFDRIDGMSLDSSSSVFKTDRQHEPTGRAGLAASRAKFHPLEGDHKTELSGHEHTHCANANATDEDAAMDVCVANLLVDKGLKWIQQELYDRELEGSGTKDAILARYKEMLLAEARQRRENQSLEEAKRARREAIEAEKRIRQTEEIERKLREKEAELNIKRKERDAQKAFFEQMELQKALQAKRAVEHQQMEFEDVISRKFNDRVMMEEDRVERNEQMAKKVTEIEREREENEREQYQVELQRQRLEGQHKKREDLKCFQKEFELNQFVCSAVEAYNLDLAASFANFVQLGDGAATLATDLNRFYALKAAQIEDSASKRLQSDKMKNEIKEKELALRNMERVLIKAKSTGMIARAGLGTVRIVPISAAEIAIIARELDEKRDELARLLHDQSLLTQDLAWKDKVLQRLSVLIKRNEGFRTELLGKLANCADLGNEMVLCVREEIEQLFEKRERNENVVHRIRIRLQQLDDETSRAAQATTEYFDTRLRVEGTTQRVLRKVLIAELEIERTELDKKNDAFGAEATQIRANLKIEKAKLTEFAAATHHLEGRKDLLEAAVPPKEPPADTTDKSEVDESYTGARHDEAGDAVRRKKHSERTPEEKKWIAMDFELNFAYYYKHIDATEVEIIQKHPDYPKPKLKKSQLERLLQLPARNCLALAFLKSVEELEAHALLRKYSFGDSERHFAQLDHDFVLPGTAEPPAAVVSTLEAVVASLERVENPLLRSRSVLLTDRTTPPIRLLTESQRQIPPHKTVTHTFRLPTQAVGVLCISVSIVFQGHFKSVGYRNGRLAGMMYALPPSTSLQVPLPIGKCLQATDIALCSPHSLGKLVLRHDPANKPISADAMYQVVLGAPVLTTYSMEITATTATFASEVLRKKKADALKKQELLPLKRDEIKNVFTTIQLSERKKRLASKMANEAKDAARHAEMDMLRQTKLLEADSVLPQLSQDQRRALHSRIQAAEGTFTHQCFLFAKREEEVRDIEAGLKELSKIHADLLEQVDSMERDLVDYREYLPQLAAALVESKQIASRDAAGARLAKELNVEYVSLGARSGKVIWAELSAMKAKLPSMMTPAERLRRKYKKGQDELEKKEREWILVDRILHPRLYEWEERLVTQGNARMRLHGAHPRLSKDEEQLAVLSQMEIERILKAPWNLLERKEIQVRKIFTRFRDDGAGSGLSAVEKRKKQSPTTMVAMLRSQKVTDLTTEEREWRQYDQLLNPVYYPLTLQNIADEVKASKALSSGSGDVKIPPNVTREDLVMALNTPEEELFKLHSVFLHARSLLLKYDPQLSTNLVEAARMQHGQDVAYEKVELDVDARCRLVYTELQRAIANTRNEFMDSSALHSTLQRFPTKVLRLELEKELDRLLMSQVIEKEQYELKNFLAGGARQQKKKKQLGLVEANKSSVVGGEEPISESDSDEEAQIARERRAQEQTKVAAKQGPRDKVRGKALKQKTIQKQRREIKDALQGRSLEEQRTLLEEQQLGRGGCMACRSNPCKWKPFLQESHVTIQSRIEVLQEELERVKRSPDLVISSTVCLAAVKSGNRAVTLRKVDLFDELTFEMKIWDKNLRLRAVDEEFHNTFVSKEQYFETKALHGFRQIQLKEKVQVALHREHNLLVANLTSYEVVEDILEFMLEGWIFGERESERQVLGYVPSLKREGPLTMHDLRKLEEEKRVLDAQASLTDEDTVQGIPLDKWKPIEVAAFEINEKNKAVKKGSEMDKQLTETENALKFGIFCMTLMYFRGLSMLNKQKTIWSTSALKQRVRDQSTKTAERKRMELEARNVAARAKKAELYDSKAHAGQARRAKLQEQQTVAYRRRMVQENQRAKREARGAIAIQRVFRGFMGRRAGKKWMLRRREIDAERALAHAAAVTLQRAYRGRLGRLLAEARRVELAEFISQVRAEEAIDEEDEYWRRHRVERVARQVAAFIKKQA